MIIKMYKSNYNNKRIVSYNWTSKIYIGTSIIPVLRTDSMGVSAPFALAGIPVPWTGEIDHRKFRTIPRYPFDPLPVGGTWIFTGDLPPFTPLKILERSWNFGNNPYLGSNAHGLNFIKIGGIWIFTGGFCPPLAPLKILERSWNFGNNPYLVSNVHGLNFIKIWGIWIFKGGGSAPLYSMMDRYLSYGRYEASKSNPHPNSPPPNGNIRQDGNIGQDGNIRRDGNISGLWHDT